MKGFWIHIVSSSSIYQSSSSTNLPFPLLQHINSRRTRLLYNQSSSSTIETQLTIISHLSCSQNSLFHSHPVSNATRTDKWPSSIQLTFSHCGVCYAVMMSARVHSFTDRDCSIWFPFKIHLELYFCTDTDDDSHFEWVAWASTVLHAVVLRNGLTTFHSNSFSHPSSHPPVLTFGFLWLFIWRPWIRADCSIIGPAAE